MSARMITSPRTVFEHDRYDVFDPEGRYVAKFYHPRAETVQVFRKNKMYSRVEEEVYGIDVLRKYSLIWE